MDSRCNEGPCLRILTVSVFHLRRTRILEDEQPEKPKTRERVGAASVDLAALPERITLPFTPLQVQIKERKLSMNAMINHAIIMPRLLLRFAHQLHGAVSRMLSLSQSR